MSKDQLAEYSKLAGKELDVGAFMTYVMKYMMDKGIKLDNTEGMIEASVFPVNYFTLKQVRGLRVVCFRYVSQYVEVKGSSATLHVAAAYDMLATCFLVGDKCHMILEECKSCGCNKSETPQARQLSLCESRRGTDRHLALFDVKAGLKSTYLAVPPCPRSVASCHHFPCS